MKHYNLRHFLRAMPNEQLQAYFNATHPSLEVNFSELKAQNVEAAFQKIQKLPKKIGQQVDTCHHPQSEFAPFCRCRL